MSITFMNRISRVAIAARSMLLVAVIVLAVPVFAAPGEGLRGSVVRGDLGGLLGLPVSLDRRMSAEYIGRQSWLVQSEPILRRRIRGAKADPETSRPRSVESRRNSDLVFVGSAFGT
ncbi:MAG: hypothetical protein WB041_33665 [Pseudolabrys sp.]